MKKIFWVTFVLVVIYLLVKNPGIYSTVAQKTGEFFGNAVGAVTGK